MQGPTNLPEFGLILKQPANTLCHGGNLSGIEVESFLVLENLIVKLMDSLDGFDIGLVMLNKLVGPASQTEVDDGKSLSRSLYFSYSSNP